MKLQGLQVFIMKKIFLLLYVLLSIQNAQARDLVRFPVHDMASTSFDTKFELLSDDSFGKIILDCQSILHHIGFYQTDYDGKEDILFLFYLDSNQCVEIFRYIEESLLLGKHVCIELNSYSSSYRLNRDYKDCN